MQTTLEVWKFVDYEMHHDMDVEDSNIDAETEHSRESAAYADC